MASREGSSPYRGSSGPWRAVTKTAFRAGAVTDPERRPGQPRAAEKGRGAGGRGGERGPRGGGSIWEPRAASATRSRNWRGAGPRRGTPRARGSTRAASASPGFRRLAPLSLQEGHREGRRLGPPPAPALRGGRGCRRETGGTNPERRNQFGRSLGADREKGGCGGRARGRGAGIGEEPLVSRESRRSRRQLDELPGAPGQPRAP